MFLPISPPRASSSRTRCPLELPPTLGLQGIRAMLSTLTVNMTVLSPKRAHASDASQPAWPAPTTMMSKNCSRFFMLFLLYFFSYSFSLFFFVIFFFFVYCVVGFWFYFYFLGRGPGFFALGSCGKPQRGRKATAPLHTPRAFFRSSWVVVWGTVLTFICMLRYWM